MQYLAERRGLKYSLNLQVKCYKEKDGEKIYASPHFWSNATIVLNNDNVEIDLSKAHQKIFKSFDTYLREGSGWVFDEVVKIDVRLANYVPLQGNSFIPTPPSLRSKHCLVNVRNDDNKCFAWAVLSALKNLESHPERVAK